MASNYKILGQLDLTTASLTDLYTCPASTETVVSTVIIANRASAADTFRLAIRTEGMLSPRSTGWHTMCPWPQTIRQP